MSHCTLVAPAASAPGLLLAVLRRLAPLPLLPSYGDERQPYVAPWSAKSPHREPLMTRWGRQLAPPSWSAPLPLLRCCTVPNWSPGTRSPRPKRCCVAGSGGPRGPRGPREGLRGGGRRDRRGRGRGGGLRRGVLDPPRAIRLIDTCPSRTCIFVRTAKRSLHAAPLKTLR